MTIQVLDQSSPEAFVPTLVLSTTPSGKKIWTCIFNYEDELFDSLVDPEDDY